MTTKRDYRRNTRLTLVYGLIVASVVITVYDILAIQYGGTDSSISRTLLGDFTIVPMVPFSLGLLIGILVSHLFWSQPAPKLGGVK